MGWIIRVVFITVEYLVESKRDGDGNFCGLNIELRVG